MRVQQDQQAGQHSGVGTPEASHLYFFGRTSDPRTLPGANIMPTASCSAVPLPQLPAQCGTEHNSSSARHAAHPALTWLPSQYTLKNSSLTWGTLGSPLNGVELSSMLPAGGVLTQHVHTKLGEGQAYGHARTLGFNC